MILLAINNDQDVSNYVNNIMHRINKYDNERNTYISECLKGVAELLNDLPDDTYADRKLAINYAIKCIEDAVNYPMLVNITDVGEEK